MLEVQLPKEQTFHLPEGAHDAVIAEIKPSFKQTGRGKQAWVRILFDVDIRGMEHFHCRAGRSFPLNLKPGSDLYNFLIELLGANFFKERSGEKFDLEAALVGLECEVELSHFQGDDDYKHPLVVVDRATPRRATEPAAKEKGIAS